jgi:hypothetical protein
VAKDKLPQKETDIFDDLTSGEFQNFLLVEHPSGNLVIAADHSKNQDETKLEILYVRATEKVLKKLKMLELQEVEGQVTHRDEDQKKIWKG